MRRRTKIRKGIKVRMLFNIVENHFNISEEDIRSKLRHRYITDMRTMMSVIMFNDLKVEQKIDVAYFLNIDHSSVVHHLKKHDKLIMLNTKDESTVSYQKDFQLLSKLMKESSTPELRAKKIEELRIKKEKIELEIEQLES